jgi:glyoxylase-like metal-dependent hydrolase (beta-lactamase superfamily II)
VPRKRLLLVVAALAAGAAAAAFAQRDFSKVEIKDTELAPGIHMLMGAGGNMGVLAGDDGMVLIDDQFAELNDKIRAALAKISDKPLRFILNTHWHGDHTGGNEAFAKTGVTILAQDNARARMSVDYTNPVFGWQAKASPAAALPVITFNDSVSFHLDGQDVACFHVPNAHTDGDVMVWFPRANVIHMGDCLFNGFYPVIDVGTGGTIDGMIHAEERALKIINADTRVIPGHGPLATRADLQAAHDMLIVVRDRVKKLLAERKTLDQMLVAKPLADLEDKWGKGGVPRDLFLKTVVADLGRKK